MKKGFTLIETLVAIAIMMLAIAGPLTIAHKGVQSALYAKDQVTAYYLAQDAVEYVRAIRDHNFLANTSWLTGLALVCKSPKLCSIDTTVSVTSLQITECSPKCNPLSYDSVSGNYNTSGSVSSPFSRTITITTPTSASGPTDTDGFNATVHVTVSWDTGLFTQTFTVKENLMNLYEI